MRKSISGPDRGRVPHLAGTTIGTWRVLYLAEVETRQRCMCQCVRCGVKKFIDAFKFRKGYALRCRECRIREAFVGIESDARGAAGREAGSERQRGAPVRHLMAMGGVSKKGVIRA